MDSTIKRVIKKDGLFILMHKDIEVCSIDINENGEIKSVIINKDNIRHMPLGSDKNINSFRAWWNKRAIPTTRRNAKTALEKLGYINTSIVLIDNLALSLNDCYWIKPVDSDLKWKNVSLFSNDFEDVFGDITLDSDKKINIKDKTLFNSATSTGELQKKWCIDKDKRRMLIKGNYGLSYQQSLNEVFASQLHKKLNYTNYVEYILTELSYKNSKNALGCASYCFCSEDVESISIADIFYLEKKKNDESNFSHLRNACLKLGIKPQEFDDYFDYLIMTDFLITNIDRHLNNISILRNPDTLEVIGFSPIYDFGNSMFFSTPTSDFDYIDILHIKIHSLTDEEIKMLKYVKNRNIIDLDKIDMDFSIYDKDIIENQIRKEQYIKMFKYKKALLKEFQEGVNIFNRHSRRR